MCPPRSLSERYGDIEDGSCQAEVELFRKMRAKDFK